MSIATSSFSPPPAAPAAMVTPDDLLKMEQQGLFELVDGELIEKPMGSLSGETAVIVSSQLYPFIRSRGLGKLFSETSFRCFPDKPNQVRRPDIAFIASGRLAKVPVEGHIPIRPDLAIEVISPGYGVYDLDTKLLDYGSAGVPLVWALNPAARILRIYRADRSMQELSDTETIDGESILPGFRVRVSELLPV